MRVMVINSNQRYASEDPLTGIVIPFPPVGAKGTVISGPDIDGDYDILFDDWPPVSNVDPGWFAHKTMIVFIDDDKEKTGVEESEELYA